MSSPIEDRTPNSDQYFGEIYGQLRSLAEIVFARRSESGHTLQPTAVVHELYLRLVNAEGTTWKSREHFLALSAQAMRQILSNHARAKRADKRGGGRLRVTLHGEQVESGSALVDFLELEEALNRLEGIDPVQARIVELRFFGGLTFKEIATVLETSESTARREWRMARAELVLLMGEPEWGGADGTT